MLDNTFVRDTMLQKIRPISRGTRRACIECDPRIVYLLYYFDIYFDRSESYTMKNTSRYKLQVVEWCRLFFKQEIMC